jgi:hypothetical protein
LIFIYFIIALPLNHSGTPLLAMFLLVVLNSGSAKYLKADNFPLILWAHFSKVTYKNKCNGK